ncbi:hypothetical protein DXG01_005230 [Tephrocybe rancida]|nr:hypothetical protein DXG01_005230 [Tephrocybe rancida]
MQASERVQWHLNHRFISCIDCTTFSFGIQEQEVTQTIFVKADQVWDYVNYHNHCLTKERVKGMPAGYPDWADVYNTDHNSVGKFWLSDASAGTPLDPAYFQVAPEDIIRMAELSHVAHILRLTILDDRKSNLFQDLMAVEARDYSAGKKDLLRQPHSTWTFSPVLPMANLVEGIITEVAVVEVRGVDIITVGAIRVVVIMLKEATDRKSLIPTPQRFDTKEHDEDCLGTVAVGVAQGQLLAAIDDDTFSIAATNNTLVFRTADPLAIFGDMDNFVMAHTPTQVPNADPAAPANNTAVVTPLLNDLPPIPAQSPPPLLDSVDSDSKHTRLMTPTPSIQEIM